MGTRTHFLYRIDMWTIDGEDVIEHLADVEDFQVAMATYRAACECWPDTAITLRQGARVIEDSCRSGLFEQGHSGNRASLVSFIKEPAH